jgi:hypothetical protein
LNVAFGSKTEVAPLERHFSFTLRQAALACPKSAMADVTKHMRGLASHVRISASSVVLGMSPTDALLA